MLDNVPGWVRSNPVFALILAGLAGLVIYKLPAWFLISTLVFLWVLV